jgi:RNA polymerase sigma-70 factor (ECF subfamily)
MRSRANIGEHVARRASASARADLQLLSRLRRGEDAAFETLVRDASPAMLASARRILGSESAARAAVEEAFAAAFASIDSLPERTALDPWLQRLVVRAAVRKRRELGARPDPLHDALLPQFTEHGGWIAGPRRWVDFDEGLDDRSREVVRECVDALPELDREVFLLREIEGMDATSVAAELGVDETDVKLGLHRARSELKGLLEKRLDLAA